jgi:hypothetical protein
MFFSHIKCPSFLFKFGENFNIENLKNKISFFGTFGSNVLLAMKIKL